MTTESMSPIVRRVRAYFAPVNRATEQPTIFDPAASLALSASSPQWAPPAPWIDLGWINNFTRRSEAKIAAVKTGAPASVYLQTRTDIEAVVSFHFEGWNKLQLALSAGTQQMNLLNTASGATAEGSGGTAIAATALASGSTATVLQMTASAAAAFRVGEWIAVDVDYTGQTGYLGSGVSGACVRSALTDVDYVRRVTLNVGRIAAIGIPAAGATPSAGASGSITLEHPLIAGSPTAAMKVSGVVGFCDREGSSFFQEWSALFVAEGQQGERVTWFYPRLQTMTGAAESIAPSSGGCEKTMLAAAFRALPVNDPVDGETVVCFRSYATA